MDDVVENSGVSVKQSNFVSVVAWIFIVLSGFATIISLMQNVMVNTVFPPQALQTPTGKDAENMPMFAAFMFANLRLVVFGFFVVCASTFVCSVALLKRKNWARIAFICLLGFGIVWNLGGLAIQYFVLDSFPKPGMPSDAMAGMEIMFRVMMIVTTIIAVAISGLFVWIIVKLNSESVRREFLHSA